MGVLILDIADWLTEECGPGADASYTKDGSDGYGNGYGYGYGE